MKVPNPLVDAIYAGIKKANKEFPRSHLGASSIGGSCDLKIWFDFRWIAKEDFDGRMLRLFKRGLNEELPLVGDLRRAGLKVDDINPITKKQFSFKDGFFAGSCDGIVTSGVPEAPEKKHVLEIKTHSLKSFTNLEKNGVQKSNPQHYSQMQVYMGMFDINRALYVSVCKDNDRIYIERVRFDKALFDSLCTRAHRIISSDRMPEPLSSDPTWFECKFCSASDVCHGKSMAKEVHCRTCSHITFTPQGEANCAHWESDVPTEAQVNGCDAHILHPDLVPWPMVIDDGKVSWKIGETLVRNGEPEANVFTSKELIANSKACAGMIGDTFAQEARMELGARIGA